jgi:hypothetical protein
MVARACRSSRRVGAGTWHSGPTRYWAWRARSPDRWAPARPQRLGQGAAALRERAAARGPPCGLSAARSVAAARPGAAAAGAGAAAQPRRAGTAALAPRPGVGVALWRHGDAAPASARGQPQ